LRCPRCNSRVMPGAEQCPACGARTDEGKTEESFYPPRAEASVPDLLYQKDRINTPSVKAEKMWRNFLGRSSQVRTLFGVPPFGVALSGMFLGLWFKRHEYPLRRRIAMISEGLAVAFLLAAAWLEIMPLILLIVLLTVMAASGIEAVRLHLWELDLSRPRVLVMSVLTVVMVYGAGYTVMAASTYLMDIAVIPLRVELGNGDHIEEGSVCITSESGFERGDVIIYRSRMYRVLAVSGDVIEVVEGDIFINQNKAKPGMWPLDEEWRNLRQDVSLPEYEVGSNELLAIRRYGSETNWEYHKLKKYRQPRRLSLIIWPLRKWRFL